MTITQINYDTIINLKNKYQSKESLQLVDIQNSIDEVTPLMVKGTLDDYAQPDIESEKLLKIIKNISVIEPEEDLDTENEFDINFDFVEDLPNTTQYTIIDYLVTNFFDSNILAENIVKSKLTSHFTGLKATEVPLEGYAEKPNLSEIKTAYNATDLINKYKEKTKQNTISVNFTENFRKDIKSQPDGFKNPIIISGTNVAGRFQVKTAADWADEGLDALDTLVNDHLSISNIANKIVKAFKDRSLENGTSTSSAIGILAKMVQYPDFMSNMYTAYLFTSNGNVSNLSLPKEGEVFSQDKINQQSVYNEFCFRLEGIDIPQPKKDPYEIQFLNTSVKGVNNITTINRSVDIQIRDDSYLHFCTFLENKSGIINNWTTKDKIGRLPDHSLLYNKNGTKKNIEFNAGAKIPSPEKRPTDEMILVVFQSISPRPPILPEAKGSLTRGDSTYRKLMTLNPDVSLNSNGQSTENRFKVWVFEGVRFLGRNSALSFSSTNADPVVGSYKFMFRKVSTVYKTYNDSKYIW